ncbi:MAG: malto-oligosyltrehalose trehalohydrolase [Bacteroidales bacterium]
MNTSLLEQRNSGINFYNNTPVVRVWAPNARKIAVKVEGKDIFPLEKMPYGYWANNCPDIEPGDRYFIEINSKDLFPDPASLSQPDGVHKASGFIDLQEIRKIHHPQWKGISTRDLIIYELHTGTFSPEGTFRGIAGKLPYLKKLGINAIKIMPVSSFPGNRNWGYDGVFPFAVHQAYGGAYEFAQLVKACHEQGIAVILDVVYNHLGPEGNYLNAFGPYFTGKYQTPWGKAINFDDAWCDGVRNYFLENALMWLRDFHIDGLRLDAVHAIKDFGPKHFLRELSEHVQLLNQKTGSQHFLIGECDLNDTRFISPINNDGYGLDAQWCDEWHHALHAFLTGEKNGYYADFGKVQHLVKSFNHAYVYNGTYSNHRKKIFGTSTVGLPGEKFVVFTQNHDQVGNRMLGDRLSTLVDIETLKLAAGAMFVSPYIPMLFMGEEYAEDNPFLYFISHGDKHLVEQVRKGRKREFRDFMKDANPPDPFAESTFDQSKLKWDFDQHDHKSKILAFYQRCIELRKNEKLMQPGKRDQILARNNDKDVIILSRRTDKNLLVAIMNFSEKKLHEEISELKDKNPELLIYSAHKKWAGKISNKVMPFQMNNENFVAEPEGRSIAIFKSGD